MDEDFTPAKEITITDLDALKVIADPLRSQILELLTHEPLTVNQLSDKLGLAPSKLYYHVNMLEKHNFMQVVDTSIHGNIIEKHYWITAYNFELDKEMLDFRRPEDRQDLSDLLVATIDTTREDLIRSLEARSFNLEQGAEEKPRQIILHREVRLLSDEQAVAFYDRLKALYEEFDILEPEGDDTQAWAMAITYYPSFYYDHLEEQEQK